MLLMAMAKVTSVLVLLALTIVGQALTPATYFTQADRERLLNVFSAAFGDDVELMHYSILGFSLLDETLPDPQKACEQVKIATDTSNVHSLFYGTSAASNIKGTDCVFPVGEKEALLNAAITEEASSETIFHAVAALTNLKLKVDAKKVTAALDAALKADESPLSHAFAFKAAAYLTGDLKKFHDLIEDIIAQADEVDDKYLQYEGGLYTSAVVVDAAYALSSAANTAPTLNEDQVLKFANYFLSRKHVQSTKNAAAVLSVIKTFTTNKFHVPIAVSLASQVSVSDKSPVVQVRVSDLLGNSLGKLSVTAEKARHIGDDAVVLSKQAFAQSKSDNALYELDFMQLKPACGFYNIALMVEHSKPDKRFLGTSLAEVEVKVTTQVVLENVEIGVADKEQTASPRTTKLQHPNKAATVLEADHHQRVVMRFTLRDKLKDEAMRAHQTFIRLTHTPSGREIAFVAEADAADQYKFDLDVGAKAKEFGYLSGTYSMDLIVGDAVIQNPISWNLADVAVSFPENPVTSDDVDYRYKPRPEIQHVFREPESRPSTAVSNLFTLLLVVPVLILLILWLRIGVNISNFPLSISAIGFHLGLAAIFGLYYCYWTHLNMFTTLRYLGIIGVPTFLFGNRMLSSIAAKRK